MKQIKLTQDKVALVDDKDFDWLNQWKWYFDSSTGYATRKDPNKVYLHRLINNTPQGKQTDHINRDRLDNRRENLRTVTPTLNMQNSSTRNTNKSGFKGIWFWKQRNKWEVSITANYKKIHLGLFKDIKDAIEARRKGEELYWV